MYYFISFTIYIFLLVALIFAFKKYKNEKEDGKLAEEKYVANVLKELNISHIKSKKRRMKALPFSHRFCYRLWYVTTILIAFSIPLAIYGSQYFVIKELYVPDITISYLQNEIALVVLVFSGMFLGMPVAAGFSYLTYSENIKRASLLNRGFAFQSIGKIANIMLSFFLILIAVPITVMSYNTYTYWTMEEIVKKSALSFSEERYSYYDVECIEQKTYAEGDVVYTARMKTGEKVVIYSGKVDPYLTTVFRANHLEVEEVWNISTA